MNLKILLTLKKFIWRKNYAFGKKIKSAFESLKSFKIVKMHFEFKKKIYLKVIFRKRNFKQIFSVNFT
jgi:hypothetical protein